MQIKYYFFSTISCYGCKDNKSQRNTKVQLNFPFKYRGSYSSTVMNCTFTNLPAILKGFYRFCKDYDFKCEVRVYIRFVKRAGSN